MYYCRRKKNLYVILMIASNLCYLASLLFNNIITIVNEYYILYIMIDLLKMPKKLRIPP